MYVEFKAGIRAFSDEYRGYKINVSPYQSIIRRDEQRWTPKYESDFKLDAGGKTPGLR